MKRFLCCFVLIFFAAAFLIACKGGDGPVGPVGGKGGAGGSGTAGRNAYLTAQALTLTIESAKIAPDGRASATFRITDGNGLPLDRTGLYTEGTVTASFVLAWLDQDAPGSPRQYTTYTTQLVTSPITSVQTAQPAPDAGGTFAEVGVGNGTYTYTFKTVVPAGHRDRTHTVAAFATRPFNNKLYSASATYDFVPAGSAVATTREIVLNDSCNDCHGDLTAHTADRDVKLCITCHTPQNSDPDTANTLDFPVLIHKIHRGASLPSVVAGTAYQIIGEKQAVKDYSTVVYPREIENCAVCHTGAQGARWKTRPTRAICTSCHDLTSFANLVSAGSTSHGGGPQPDDAHCTDCHFPGGSSDIAAKHLTPLLDPASPVVTIAVQSVTSTAPGEFPTVVFTVTRDSAPYNILTAPLDRLAITVAGPTTDYASYWQHTIQGSGASGTLAAIDAANGLFFYTFPAPLSLAATGSYALKLEGSIQPGGLGTPQFPVVAAIQFFAVTDATPVPRRAVVSDAACNACHGTLTEHGIRQGVQYCAFCHNPNATNSTRVARFEGSTVTAQSVDLKVLIHKIHRGSSLTQPYVIGGFPAPTTSNPAGTPIDFGATRYSQDLRNCAACHLPGTFDLPLGAGRLPSTDAIWSCSENPGDDTNAYCDNPFWTMIGSTQTGPTSAACLSCHDSPDTAAHALVNTTGAGAESCATCHKTGAAFGVDTVHALAP